MSKLVGGENEGLAVCCCVWAARLGTSGSHKPWPSSRDAAAQRVTDSHSPALSANRLSLLVFPAEKAGSIQPQLHIAPLSRAVAIGLPGFSFLLQILLPP